jgi:two-component system, LytTR family, response regulator
MPIRTLIVDDEPLARERLSGLLARRTDVAVVGECGDGKTAVRAIKQKAPDLVLLDIQLPELDGFEILEDVPADKLPAIIFVTAYDRFAVRAFEVHAVDYVLKPVEADRLDRALERVLSQRLHKEFDPRARLLEFMQTIPLHGGRPDRVLLKLENEILCIKPAEIDWVESAGNYSCFHIGPQTRITRETMNAVECQLASYNFVRVHRTAIVNIERIRRLRPLLYGDYEIELCNSIKLPMSRTYRRAVLEKLKSIGGVSFPARQHSVLEP